MHDGTVINPTGIRLQAGMRVSINGYPNGPVFQASIALTYRRLPTTAIPATAIPVTAPMVAAVMAAAVMAAAVMATAVMATAVMATAVMATAAPIPIGVSASVGGAAGLARLVARLLWRYPYYYRGLPRRLSRLLSRLSLYYRGGVRGPVHGGVGAPVRGGVGAQCAAAWVLRCTAAVAGVPRRRHRTRPTLANFSNGRRLATTASCCSIKKSAALHDTYHEPDDLLKRRHIAARDQIDPHQDHGDGVR